MHRGQRGGMEASRCAYETSLARSGSERGTEHCRGTRRDNRRARRKQGVARGEQSDYREIVFSQPQFKGTGGRRRFIRNGPRIRRQRQELEIHRAELADVDEGGGRTVSTAYICGIH